MRDAWAYFLLSVLPVELKIVFVAYDNTHCPKTISTTTATLTTTSTQLQIVKSFKKIYMIDDSDEVLSLKNLLQHDSLLAVYTSMIKEGRSTSLFLLLQHQQYHHNQPQTTKSKVNTMSPALAFHSVTFDLAVQKTTESCGFYAVEQT